MPASRRSAIEGVGTTDTLVALARVQVVPVRHHPEEHYGNLWAIFGCNGKTAKLCNLLILRLDPRGLDDRPPFLGVALHERAERRSQIGAAGCLAMLWCLSRSSACRRSGNVPGCLATWNSG